LGEQFHLLGRYPLETMPYFFDRADALLLSLKKDPMYAYTAPGKLASYLASGRPILATLDGEGADIVDRAGAGISSPAQDPDALAAAIIKMYQMSKQERDALGANGRRYCEQHFEREKLFDQLEEIFRETAGVTSNENKTLQ
jgi:glycosyltransferase involved in cell wall biosynthesis